MNLALAIEQAFGWRSPPAQVRQEDARPDADGDDAQWFSGRDWRSLQRADWQARSGAITAFTPAAFAYFLPSVLTLSAAAPREWLQPADTLLQVLDRSPTPAYWDDFITSRLLGLQPAEYAALSDWLLLMAEHAGEAAQPSYGRAFDTVDLLSKSPPNG